MNPCRPPLALSRTRVSSSENVGNLRIRDLFGFRAFAWPDTEERDQPNATAPISDHYIKVSAKQGTSPSASEISFRSKPDLETSFRIRAGAILVPSLRAHLYR